MMHKLIKTVLICMALGLLYEVESCCHKQSRPERTVIEVTYPQDRIVTPRQTERDVREVDND